MRSLCFASMISVGLLLLSAGCGARSSLWFGDAPDRPDAGDSGVDVGPDTIIDSSVDTGPEGVSVDCGRSVQYTSPRRALELVATATSSAPITVMRWEILDPGPPPAPDLIVNPDMTRATYIPFVEGSAVLQFTATDATGSRASCTVTVESVVGPPIAICPEEDVLAVPDVPVDVVGDGFDDEAVVAYRWEIIDGAPGSTLENVETPVARFTARERGAYRLRLTVFDADGAMGRCEVTVLVTGPPIVMCGMERVRVPTREQVRLRASSTDDVGVVSETWELIGQPPGSTATLTRRNGDRTRLTPDRQGEYLVRFTATDVEGFSASCDIVVIGTPTPPVVTCPGTIVTEPLVPTPVSATGIDDSMIVSWRWELIESPPGSGAGPPSPRNAPDTVFTPDIAGVYRLLVTATDDDGMTGMCTTTIDASNVDGLRVEMFWDTDNTDIDLHLLNPVATAWVNGDDCYYGNCVGGGPDWGLPGVDDNPRLDIDNTSGFGPENINIFRPVAGTYRIGVHYYASSLGAGPPTAVTVRVYCGGSTTMPAQTFGPVTIRDLGGPSDNEVWRVADVAIDGLTCTITDLSGPGGVPNIDSPWSISQSMR